MMNKIVPVYAGAMVFDEEGRILCQLRDEKPEISWPGWWTCSPGGHIEEGENPLEAIIRELYEEFEVSVIDLRPHITLIETCELLMGIYHCFIARLYTPKEKIICHEGQCVVFKSVAEILSLKHHPVSNKFLYRYLLQQRLTFPN